MTDSFLNSFNFKSKSSRIVSRLPGLLTSLPEIGGDAAFYWDNFDSIYMRDFLFESLTDFDTNPNKYLEKIRTRARYFSWEKAALQYLELYKK